MIEFPNRDVLVVFNGELFIHTDKASVNDFANSFMTDCFRPKCFRPKVTTVEGLEVTVYINNKYPHTARINKYFGDVDKRRFILDVECSDEELDRLKNHISYLQKIKCI